MKSTNLTVILLSMERTLTESETTVIKRLLLNKSIVHVLLILFLSLLAYSNTFQVPFVFDDEPNIVNNPVIKNLNFYIEPSKAKVFEGFAEYPMLKQRYIGSLTFALNYRLHGLDVTGYHIVNLLIHILNALLIYFLIVLTFQAPYMSNSSLKEQSKFIAFFAALFFVSHPIQTQAVTYIVQRFASLATLFYLLSLVMYIKARLTSTSTSTLTFYFLSLISAVLAMKTKEIAFTLPVVTALYEFMFFDGKIKRRLLYLLPLLLTMLIIPLSLIGLDKPIGDLIGDVSEATKVQAGISRWDYLFTQFRVIVTYIRLIFLPVNQNLDYDYSLYHSFFNPEVFLSFLFLVFISGLGVFFLFLSRGRDRALRLTAFGVFWFFITLSVESSIIPLYVIFEHRVYLPSVGVFVGISMSMFMVIDKLKGKWQAMLISALVVITIVLTGASYARNIVWADAFSLWQDVVSKSPGNARGITNLGSAYADEKQDYNKAIELYNRATDLDPYNVIAYINRGDTYMKMGKYDKALDDCTNVVAKNPDIYNGYYVCGNVYSKMGEYDKAVKEYTKAITIKPYNSDIYYNIGNIYSKTGKYDKAIKEYTKAITINPYSLEPYHNRGDAYAKTNRFSKAIEDFTKEITIAPDSAIGYSDRGFVYLNIGRYSVAVKDFTRAIAIEPDDAKAYMRRGFAYIETGNVRSAIPDFKKACEMGSIISCGALKGLN